MIYVRNTIVDIKKLEWWKSKAILGILLTSFDKNICYRMLFKSVSGEREYIHFKKKYATSRKKLQRSYKVYMYFSPASNPESIHTFPPVYPSKICGKYISIYKKSGYWYWKWIKSIKRNVPMTHINWKYPWTAERHIIRIFIIVEDWEKSAMILIFFVLIVFKIKMGDIKGSVEDECNFLACSSFNNATSQLISCVYQIFEPKEFKEYVHGRVYK